MVVKNMVATLPVIDALHQTSSVTAIALHPTSGHLLIGNDEGLVQYVNLNSEANDVVASINVNSKIMDVAWSTNKIVILDENNGLHIYSMDGEEVWASEFDAGGAQLIVGKQILALDGIGTLRQFTLDGQEYPNIQRDVRSVSNDVNGALLIMEDQTVMRTDENLNPVFRRKQRGDIGEDIVAVGRSIDGSWFVAREGHALVPGDEEALELEIYQNDMMVSREEIKGRVKASSTQGSIHILGLDNGDLVSLNNNQHQVLATFQYPIQSLKIVDNIALIGTWFYIYGWDLESNEVAWQIEHKGMVDGIQVDESGRMAFYGEDQNDWTGAEPVGVCNMHQERIDVDPSFLQGWFEEDVVEVETNPDIVYRNVDDYTNLLSVEEQKSLEMKQNDFEVGLDSLSAAMEEELKVESHKESEQDIDELLQFLHDDAKELIAPQAYAGENQVVSTDTESAVITLDGTQSADPQDRIEAWSWLDASGREISTEAKLKVKLSKGMHQFELRVFDVDGSMTTDSVQITIESSAS
jgi:hypothetical protein